MAFNMLEVMGVFNDAADIPEIVMLDVDQLHDSDENFYFTQDQQSEKIRIKNEELKASIEMFGVMEPLIVEPIGHDEYNIIAGHRRRLISKRIVDEGKDGYRKIPCIIDTGRVKEDYQAEFNDQVKNALMGLKLIQLNSTNREIDGWQQTEQVRCTKEKLLILKENGVKMPGRMRSQIAVLTGMSRTEVGRHEQIDKNLDDNFKELYKNGEIVEHTASTLAAMSSEDQRAVYEKTDGKATVKDIEEYKDQKNQSEPEEMDDYQLEPELLIVDGTANPLNTINKNNADDFYDEYGRTKVTKYCRQQQYKEFDKTITIKDDRLPEGGFKLYIVQDKEDNLWRSSAARGFVEVGAGRYPHRDADNPKDSKHFPAFQTMEEALKYATGQMFWHCDEIQTEILRSQGYEEPQKEPDFSEIRAAQYVMDLLMKNIDKCSKLREINEQEGNQEAAVFEVSKIEYLGKTIKRVQQDLFEMTGNDMFKE